MHNKHVARRARQNPLRGVAEQTRADASGRGTQDNQVCIDFPRRRVHHLPHLSHGHVNAGLHHAVRTRQALHERLVSLDVLLAHLARVDQVEIGQHPRMLNDERCERQMTTRLRLPFFGTGERCLRMFRFVEDDQEDDREGDNTASRDDLDDYLDDEGFADDDDMLFDSMDDQEARDAFGGRI